MMVTYFKDKSHVCDSFTAPYSGVFLSRASERSFADYRDVSASTVKDVPTRMLDELWQGDWQKGLKMLEERGDPMHVQLQSVYSEIMGLEPLEKWLWEFFKLPGTLDAVMLRQRCGESVRSERDGPSGKQKREWLQSLDRLHRLRKEKIDILTDLTDKYQSCPDMNQETLKHQNVWAVLIGIDQYRTVKPLRGAVRDTEMMKQYLESDLSVPSNHIRILTDANATRTAILSALYDHLRDNVEIQRGDTILIYYSGHGTSYDVHELLQNADDSIEAICPVDRGVEDAYQGNIMDISDREINLFLVELSSTKGDNITLVLDCCYTEGPARAESSFQPRTAPPLTHSLEKMLLAAENNPRKRWARGSALAEDWTPDLSSYVVLVACQDFERAWENNNGQGGDFTIALLKALRSLPLQTSSYRDLIGRIGGLRRQQPYAVGNHVDNCVFNHKLAPHYSIARKPEKNHPVEVDHCGKLVRLFRWFVSLLVW